MESKKVTNEQFQKVFHDIFKSEYNDGINMDKIPVLKEANVGNSQELYHMTQMAIMFTVGYKHGTQDPIGECIPILLFMSSDTMKRLAKDTNSQDDEARWQCFKFLKTKMHDCM